MRLWHYELIPYISNQRLLGQHRECCALRGNGWGKPHKTINYIFQYNYKMLVWYHRRVMQEMVRRGYTVRNSHWFTYRYRGTVLKFWHKDALPNIEQPRYKHYAEHNKLMFLCDVNDLLDREDTALPHALLSSEQRNQIFNKMLS